MSVISWTLWLPEHEPGVGQEEAQADGGTAVQDIHNGDARFFYKSGKLIEIVI